MGYRENTTRNFEQVLSNIIQFKIFFINILSVGLSVYNNLIYIIINR